MFIHHEGETFRLGSPLRIDRPWESSGAFGLPPPNARFYKFGDFVGSIKDGGVCNVRILEYCPHNLTHIETSDHVFNDGTLVSELGLISGVMVLADLSIKGQKGQIQNGEIAEMSEIIGIKTYSSLLPQEYDFTSKNFISLSAELTGHLARKGAKILVTDLPSIDHEESKSLWAHKNFFRNGGKAIIELAHFGKAEPGYYFFNCIPPLVPYDAAHVGAIIYPLKSVQSFDLKH